MRKFLILSSVILVAVSCPLLAVTVSVDAMSNIFEAGLGTPGTTVGVNMGFFPTLGLTFTAASGQTISFDSVTGGVKYGGSVSDPTLPGDGTSNPFGNAGTGITSNTGVSGITFDGRVMFLIGVFLTDAAPTSGTQPADISFFSSGGGFDADHRVNWFDPSTTFAIGQTFYIGDGKTGFNNGSGTTQVWNIPDTATRLFLGFADGGSGGPFLGSFGAYADNTGSLLANINTSGLAAVPEPGTVMLMGLGLLGLAFLRKKIA